MTDIDKQQIRERLGNLDRIRDLLFGEKIEDYEQKFQICQNRIEQIELQLEQFNRETDARFSSLQNYLSTEIRSGFDSLEEKIKYLNLTAREKNTRLKQEIESIEQNISQNFDDLQERFTDKNNLIKNELERVKQGVEITIKSLKQQTLSEIKKEFLTLKNDKISRLDLAEILFELCLKLRGDELFSRSRQIEKDYSVSKSSAENSNSSQQLNDSHNRKTA